MENGRARLQGCNDAAEDVVLKAKVGYVPFDGSEARTEAQRLREEVDDYVDTALANFEQFLTRALASIERGRDKMHALREIGTFVTEDGERPLPF